jgi:hypothetical protein
MNDGARFARALVRSAREDAPPPGAMARARARLALGAGASHVSFGFAGAVLAAVLFATAWWPGPAGVASGTTVAGCGGGVEAPRFSCGEPSRLPGSSAAISGSSSGTALSRGSSGG